MRVAPRRQRLRRHQLRHDGAGRASRPSCSASRARAARKIGLFELAHGGTLFLDEVADMPLETQGKILRVLIDQTFQRVGGATRVQVDVRVISSSTRDLRAEIEAGPFPRGPLSPPERRAGARAVAGRAARRHSAAGVAFHEAAVGGVRACRCARSATTRWRCCRPISWPGNVRQLRNIVERLLILATDDAARSDLGRSACRRTSTAAPRPGRKGAKPDLIISLPLREAREIFEREYLLAQINRFGGNISRTASFIGMERSALHRKLKSLGRVVGAARTAVQRVMHAYAAPARAASPMSMAATCRTRARPCISKIAACNSPTPSTRCARSAMGMLLDEEGHLDRLERSLGELAHAHADGTRRRSWW